MIAHIVEAAVSIWLVIGLLLALALGREGPQWLTRKGRFRKRAALFFVTLFLWPAFFFVFKDEK